MIRDYSKVPSIIEITNNTGKEVGFFFRSLYTIVLDKETITFEVKTSEELAVLTARANELGLDVKGATVKVVSDEASIAEALADETITEIKLEDDITVTSTITPLHDIVIDGNNKTLTTSKRALEAKGAKIELKNVNISSDAGTPVKVLEGGVLIVDNTSSISAKGACIGIVDDAKVEVNGNLTAGNDACIAGNGLTSGANVIINEGAKLVSDDITLFIPGDGTVTINGGEIVGKTAVGIKAGTLNINGGTLTANGEKVETLKANNNGMVAWGDTIAIEVNKGYAGGKTDKNIKINVSDKAVLTSANADVIREFNPVEGITTEVTGAYTNKQEVTENTFIYTK